MWGLIDKELSWVSNTSEGLWLQLQWQEHDVVPTAQMNSRTKRGLGKKIVKEIK